MCAVRFRSDSHNSPTPDTFSDAPPARIQASIRRPRAPGIFSIALLQVHCHYLALISATGCSFLSRAASSPRARCSPRSNRPDRAPHQPAPLPRNFALPDRKAPPHPDSCRVIPAAPPAAQPKALAVDQIAHNIVLENLPPAAPLYRANQSRPCAGTPAPDCGPPRTSRLPRDPRFSSNQVFADINCTNTSCATSSAAALLPDICSA